MRAAGVGGAVLRGGVATRAGAPARAGRRAPRRQAVQRPRRPLRPRRAVRLWHRGGLRGAPERERRRFGRAGRGPEDARDAEAAVVLRHGRVHGARTPQRRVLLARRRLVGPRRALLRVTGRPDAVLREATARDVCGDPPRGPAAAPRGRGRRSGGGRARAAGEARGRAARHVDGRRGRAVLPRRRLGRARGPPDAAAARAAAPSVLPVLAGGRPVVHAGGPAPEARRGRRVRRLVGRAGAGAQEARRRAARRV
mmetsp:Transcript_21133/g.64999  ORF Transcript_21133/g.64999 Transcript_21133/m.64999 type:complete len:254 (-) Transcript_21133:79-840(-)